MGTALKVVERAVKLELDLPATHETLGTLLVRPCELSGADQHWQEAVLLDPDYAEAEQQPEKRQEE